METSKNLVGIVTFGNLQFTKLAIESCELTSEHPLDFFIVVGKPGDVETIEFCDRYRFPYIIHNVNKGFPASLNDIYDYAWKQNDYDNLIIMGNDVIAYPSTIDALINLANTSDYEAISTREFNVKDLYNDFPEVRYNIDKDSNYKIRDLNIPIWIQNVRVEDLGIQRGIIDIHNLALYKKSVMEKVGYVDANFFPCLVPETKVLTSDLVWKELKDINVGDTLVGVDEYPEKSGASRSYRKTIVEGKRELKSECLKLTLEDGKEVTCSKNHRWLVKDNTYNAGYKWKTAEELVVGKRILAPLNVWKQEDGFDAGWLSGIFDGEGCVHYGPKMRGVSFYQNKGEVLDRGKNILTEMGIPFKTYRRHSGKAEGVEINNRKFVMELLGRLRPTRLLNSKVLEGIRVRGKLGDPSLVIVKIENVGIKDVIDIQTSTRTFLANGLVTHNCYFEDNDLVRRFGICGVKDCTIPNRYFHFWSRTLHEGSGGSSNHFFENNRKYYITKWGGDVGKERFTVPFNGEQCKIGGVFVPNTSNVQTREHESNCIEYWKKA